LLTRKKPLEEPFGQMIKNLFPIHEERSSYAAVQIRVSSMFKELLFADDVVVFHEEDEKPLTPLSIRLKSKKYILLFIKHP